MWVVGQRVVAEFEPELGLGTVIEVVGARLIEVAFPATQVKRRYSQQVAPLRRLVLNPGQKVKTKEGKVLVVSEIQEQDGLFRYKSEEGGKVWEHELDHLVEDTTPLSRFLSGNWGHGKTADLRQQAWELRGKSLHPDTRGLIGSRVSLLPHQLGIASELARREIPRVLLCDEVGLGKTIEAGLIFSSLRALGRANRVLVLVPEALEHQWLAEMYRRFQEMFSLVDEERCEQDMLSLGKSSFSMNQKVLCSLSFLTENSERLLEAANEKWDLLIVDEAHRLEWNEEEPSVEWEIVRLLSERSRGLLLLTATPQRQGLETQFGLLHLVDPDRFPSLLAFKEQNERVTQVANFARQIQEENRDKKFISTLKDFFKNDLDLQKKIETFAEGGSADDLLDCLVDRHGTGRVLVRNRRSRIRGFPERELHSYPVTAPQAWKAWLDSLAAKKVADSELLCLSAGIQSNSTKAPKAEWFHAKASALASFLDEVKKEKVLLICSSPKRVRELQEWLRNNTGVRSAIFDENLEIVERDRQAAWFAHEDGAQILLCSEIGGEGRNFQFCHHLYLFDMPLHPDVLEQRIGRLDRIGQKDRIQIHVSYFEGTPEEVLLRWYQDGLDIFRTPWNGAVLEAHLQKEIKEVLRTYLDPETSSKTREQKIKSLLQNTKDWADQKRKEQKHGVDLLVDITSFSRGRGVKLAEQIQSIEKQTELKQFLEKAFNYFGVEMDKLDSAGAFKLAAHSLTFVESFPGLTASGELSGTFDRTRALVQEELALLTWEHPVVQGALSLILEADVGRFTAGIVSGVKSPDPLLLELIHVIQPTAPAHFEIERDLPIQVIKTYINVDGESVSPSKALEGASFQALNPTLVEQLMPILRQRLNQSMEKANKIVVKNSTPVVEHAMRTYQNRMAEEINRLKHLSTINPLISKDEVVAAETKLKKGLTALKSTQPRLDSIRLILFQK
ncbi:MAG: RNA polymerase-associated protein RapA [Deltaproteobacteria bacterium]|nr:RNA polymerase-associated protein RapA [Deltaproteobacteria bacterium]